MDRYRELIKENIDYDLLLTEHPYDEETLEGYVELMVEVCCSRRDFIRIAGEEMATGVVKSRFLKLNHEHIAYVLDSLSQNTTLTGPLHIRMMRMLSFDRLAGQAAFDRCVLKSHDPAR